MRRILGLAAATVVASMVAATSAMADCADVWEDRSAEASGQIIDAGQWDGGWWIEVDLVTSDDCEVWEIWNYGSMPSGCLAGGSFNVVGRFEYDYDSDDHFELWMEDALAIRAESISCS